MKNIINRNINIIKNTGWLSIIEITRLLMPLLAIPYIISVIGGYKYGEIAFAQTIISFFIIFINWGIDILAVKEVSINREDKLALSSVVSTAILLKILLFLIASAFFSILLFTIPIFSKDKLLFSFAFITCISEILFPIWFYQGIEKMKYITIIRFIAIVFYVITLFIFVKRQEDYRYVPLLQSLGNILAGFLSFYFLIYSEKIRLRIQPAKLLKKLFIDSFPFFLSRISVVANNGMAKAVSGFFLSMDLVGALDIAQKIASISMMPMQMLNQAAYPHIAKTKNRVFVNKFFFVNVLVSLSVSLGVFILAPYAIQYFADNSMPEAIPLLKILSIYTLLGGMTTYIGAPVLVSFGHSKPFNMSVLLSSLFLVLCYAILFCKNIYSVYHFASILVLAEFFILAYRLYFCYKYKILTTSWMKTN